MELGRPNASWLARAPRSDGGRRRCGVDRDEFGAFGSAVYVERALTPIDPVALVERFCETEREPVTADVRRQTR